MCLSNVLTTMLNDEFAKLVGEKFIPFFEQRRLDGHPIASPQPFSWIGIKKSLVSMRIVDTDKLATAERQSQDEKIDRRRQRLALRGSVVALRAPRFESAYKRLRFPPEIIQHAVWRYYRFNLSSRDIEDLLPSAGLLSAMSLFVCGASSLDPITPND